METARGYVEYAKKNGAPPPIKFDRFGEIVKRAVLNKPYWKAMVKKLEKR
jgi:hypothetical protein